MPSSELVTALDQVRRRAGGPGSRAYIAAVGNWLRDLGATTDTLPVQPLTRFLASLKGYCELSGAFVQFGDGPPLLPTETDMRVPAEPDGDLSTRPGPALREDLWAAMVTERTESRWFMDLETFEVIRVPLTDGNPGSPVAETPERYVTIPTIPTVQQREQARTTLLALVGEQQAVELTPEHDWLRHLHQHATSVMLAQVLRARRSWIVQQTLTWLRAQGIPEHHFVRYAPAGGNRRQPPKHSSDREAALRQALHLAIDRMTVEQLAGLNVPAWLLID